MKAFAILAITLASLMGASAPAAELDAYGGFTDIKGEKTGFFHAEQIDGRWWLVTPDGHGFFGIGISHPVTGFSEGAVNASYNGDQEAWLRDGIAKMRELGYNCVWSGPYSTERLRRNYVDRGLAERIYREEKIPHGIQVPLVKHKVEMEPGEKNPDVFSEDYAGYIRQVVAEYVAPNKDNPWVLGYYYGFGSFAQEGDWLNDILGYEPGSAGREHLLSTLEKRYGGDIKKLNSVYGKKYRSWDELRQQGGISYPKGYARRSPDPAIAADQVALLAEVVERVHELGHTAIRKVDTNHLVLGCYVKDVTFTPEIWERISPYIDVLAPQHFSPTNKIGPQVDKIGMPALLSDQVFGNVYAEDLLKTGQTPGPVPDHLDRRVLYDVISRRIAGDPDFIGISFCACLHDNAPVSKPYDRGQPGFFTVDNEPRSKTIEIARKSNAFIYESLRNPLNKAALQKLDQDYHEADAAYRTIALKRKLFLQKK